MKTAFTSPRHLAVAHVVFTWLFLVLIPVSYALGWLESVVFLAVLSLWALVACHWSAWQTSRVEVTQGEDAAGKEAAELARETNRLLKALIDTLQKDQGT
jgi:hypothetical protein